MVHSIEHSTGGSASASQPSRVSSSSTSLVIINSYTLYSLPQNSNDISESEDSKMVDFGRVQKELQECNKDTKVSGISIKPEADSLSHLMGTIPGPVDSPYEGGSFLIDIVLPDGYPFEPPKMKFLTKVWHPNISSQSGVICLDILKDQWSPALTLKTALVSIQALLSAPEPDDPQDAVVAQQVASLPACISSCSKPGGYIAISSIPSFPCLLVWAS